MNKICKYCGKEFETDGNRQVNCFKSCQNRTPFEKKCSICKKSFFGNPSKKICSKECGKINLKEKTKSSQKKYSIKKKLCSVCNEEYESTREQSKTCSKECAIERGRKQSREYNRKKNNITFNSEKRKCVVCHNKFIWKSQYPKQKYCSIECSNKFHKKKYKNITNGIIVSNDGSSCNYYRLRFEIFKRDNFTCQYCGRNVKEDKIKLHCDHIHPKSKGGLLVANNLITSCEECNEGKKDILLEERQLNMEIMKNDR